MRCSRVNRPPLPHYSLMLTARDMFEKTLLPWENAKVYQESARLYLDPVPSPVQWYEHETLVKQHVQAAVQGKESPDAALRGLQDDIDRTIKTFSQQE